MDTINSKFRQGFARKVREVDSFRFGKSTASGSGSRQLQVQEVFAELPRVVAHTSRGRDSS